jgi:hypothetical protein
MPVMRSGRQARFEFGDRLVGEPEPVEFAALDQVHDNCEQPLVGDDTIANGAGLAQVVRRVGLGIAHHLEVHDLNSAFDQHASPVPWQG